MVHQCPLSVLGEKIRTSYSTAQLVNVIASTTYFICLNKTFTRGNQGSMSNCPAGYSWTINHCSDDRDLKAGGSVTGTLREIRVQAKKPTKQRMTETNSFIG
jgi:hypothetical protein